MTRDDVVIDKIGPSVYVVKCRLLTNGRSVSFDDVVCAWSLRSFYFDGNEDEKCNNGISIDKGVFSNSMTKSVESLILKTSQTYR